MGYRNNTSNQSRQAKPLTPCPAGMTAELAQSIVDRKVAFFKNVAHPKSVYSTIINSPDETGATLEAQLGTENAKMEMTSIMFRLTTGYAHT